MVQNIQKKTLIHACEMARNYQSRLILLYVVEKTIPINLLDRKEYLEILKKFGNKVLTKGKETTIKQGVDSKIVMKEGNVSTEIIKLAKKEQCNMIIMGSKGLGKAARFFLGSVSNKMANNSPCSILIVK